MRVGSLILPLIGSELPSEPGIDYRLGDATLPQGPGKKIIGQVVNNGAALGAGFGRAMAKSWPLSARVLREWKTNRVTFRMGNSRLTQLSEDIFVFQMLAQKGVTAREKSIGLRYDALRRCLTDLAIAASERQASIHMPRIGAGQAQGDWGIIEGMIVEELVNKGLAVTVYDLPGSKPPSKKASAPTLFELPPT